MKTKFTILFFLIFSNITFSQNEKELKHTISVNLNYILDQWISRSTSSSFFESETDHNILAMYKFHHQNIDWRFGVAGLNKTESTFNGVLGTIFDKRYRIYTFSLGIQKTKKIWEKWDFISGGDLVFQYQNLKIDSNGNGIFFIGDEAKIKHQSVALNAFMGVQYRFSNRVSLSTELTLFVKRSSNKIDGESQLFQIDDPTFNIIQEDAQIDIELTPPLAIFLNFHF